MGLIIFVIMSVGCVMGLAVAATLGTLSVLMIYKRGCRHVGLRWISAAVFAAVLILLVIGVRRYPYAPVSPGSDYAIMARNLFLQGLGYCAAPGIAALSAALVTVLSVKKHTDPKQELATDLEKTRKEKIQHLLD